MKQFVGVLLLLLGVLGGVLRWIDLVSFTSAETGLVTDGSIWWRYGAVAGLVLLAVLASFMVKNRPAKMEKSSVLLGFSALCISALFAIEGALRFFVALQNQLPKVEALGITVLFSVECLLGFFGLMSALWFAVWGYSLLVSPYELPFGGVYFAILGTVTFYLQLIFAFSLNDSSMHHFTSTILIFQIAAVLAFLAVLIRAIFFPENSVGRKLYVCAMCSFYFCTCIEIPEKMFEMAKGTLTYSGAFGALVFISIGMLGAIVAQKCLCKD